MTNVSMTFLVLPLQEYIFKKLSITHVLYIFRHTSKSDILWYFSVVCKEV